MSNIGLAYIHDIYMAVPTCTYVFLFPFPFPISISSFHFQFPFHFRFLLFHMPLFALTLQNMNQNCAHEYNYVVRLPIQPVKQFTTQLYSCAQLFASHFATSTQMAVEWLHVKFTVPDKHYSLLLSKSSHPDGGCRNHISCTLLLL